MTTAYPVKRAAVDADVTVDMTAVTAIILAAYSMHLPPDDGVELPWAWAATMHLRFRIGEAQVSKRVATKVEIPLTRSKTTPTASAVDAAFGSLRFEMRRLVGRHGVVLAEDHPWKVDRTPRRPKQYDDRGQALDLVMAPSEEDPWSTNLF